MARRALVGFEIGNLSELWDVGSAVIDSTVFNTGSAYSAKVATAASVSAVWAVSELNMSGPVYAKIYFRTDSVSNPSAVLGYQAFMFTDSAFSIQCQIYIQQNMDGTWTLNVRDSADTGAGSFPSITIAANTWYRFEAVFQKGAGTGSLSIYKDGSLVESMSSKQFGANNTENVYFGGSYGGAQSRSGFYDDLEVDDAALCGESYVLARQFKSATPTHNGWTKSTGSTIDTVWNDTPFNAATSANSGSVTAAIAQTAKLADLDAVQTGHGTGVVRPWDTIHAWKIGAVAKTSATSNGGSSGNIRRIVDGVTTDVAQTLTTSDVYYESPTLASLSYASLAAAEVGWNKATSTSARTQTVEDMWAIFAYTPGTEPARKRPPVNRSHAVARAANY